MDKVNESKVDNPSESNELMTYSFGTYVNLSRLLDSLGLNIPRKGEILVLKDKLSLEK